MARTARIEYAGAVYHVISRGNYRKDLFTVGKSGEKFEEALMQACQKSGWKLHAYVIMSNHYHLCLETAEGNLVEGMRWLQGTFGNRFNRFTGERGHVFQGRYKALLLEHGDWLVSLVNYIHLNPVRAGIVNIENLKGYRLSSYPHYFKKTPPGCLCRSAFLKQAGFSVGLKGMKAYEQYLKNRQEGNPNNRKDLEKRFCRGWAIAEKKDRLELAKSLATMNVQKNWGGKHLREINEQKWEQLVVKYLEREGMSDEDVKGARKLVEWKIRIAQRLRTETAASNPWIANRLNMGHPSHVSRYAGKYQNTRPDPAS